MSHYDIDYKDIEDEVEKHNKALQDIKDYIGYERFHEITDLIRAEPGPQMSLDKFRFYAAMTGVQGFPVTSWYNFTFPL